jgi:hypothetical protein
LPSLAVPSSVALCLVLAACLLPASAQLYTGSIAGTVTDPSGAVVVSAHVTATDMDKGFKFSGKSDNAGRYLLRNIPPGSYGVSVEAPNFESQRKTGIVIAVTQNATVDFTLKIGTTSQTVEVQAQQVELQTEDAVTGQVVNRTFVNNLPLLPSTLSKNSRFSKAISPPSTASRAVPSSMLSLAQGPISFTAVLTNSCAIPPQMPTCGSIQIMIRSRL